MGLHSVMISRYLFSCGYLPFLHRTVRVWNSDTGALLHTMTGHSDEIQVILNSFKMLDEDILRVTSVKSHEGYFSFFGLKTTCRIVTATWHVNPLHQLSIEVCWYPFLLPAGSRHCESKVLH